MSKKKKSKRPKLTYEEEMELKEKELLEKLGKDAFDEDGKELDIYEIMFGLSEEIDSKDLGYQTESVAYKAYLTHDEESNQASLHLYKYKNWYIIYEQGEYVEECLYDDISNIFITKDEAEATDKYNNWEPYESSVSSRLDAFYTNYSYPVRLVPQYMNYGYGFKLYYSGMLIAEKIKALESDYISNCIESFESLNEKLKEKGLEITRIEKMHYDINDYNQRYFEVVVTNLSDRKDTYLRVHIPSKLQGKRRCITDCASIDKLIQLKSD